MNLHKSTLRARFLLATIALTVTLLLTFSLAIHQTLETVEHRFAGVEFKAEYDRVISTYEHTGAAPAEIKPGFQLFSGKINTPSKLLPNLDRISAGIHVAVDINGGEYNIGKKTLAGQTIYLLQDMEANSLEVTERGISKIVVIAGLASISAAVLLSLWLSNIVVKPVTELAKLASGHDPDRPPPVFAHNRVAPEIAAIARALEQAVGRYEDAMLRERAFTRDASHELRTPLSVMRSTLELLEQDHNLLSVHGPRVRRLRTATDQMLLLCEAMLSLARSDASNVEHGLELHTISSVVEYAIGLHSEGLRKRNSDISLRIAQECRILAPRGMLLCVMTNLLRNATDHADSTHIEVVVHATSLSISDDGRGFGDIDASVAFMRGMRRKDSKGEGLGLDIVRRICERQRWRLELYTAPQRGSRFELHFS